MHEDKISKDAQTIGIPNKFSRLMKMTMKIIKVRVANKEIRQGDRLTTTMYNVEIEGIMRASRIKGRVRGIALQFTA